MMPAPVMEPAVHIKGQEPLTPSMLAAAPHLEQKQLLGTAWFLLLMLFLFFFSTCLHNWTQVPLTVELRGQWYAAWDPAWSVCLEVKDKLVMIQTGDVY